MRNRIIVLAGFLIGVLFGSFVCHGEEYHYAPVAATATAAKYTNTAHIINGSHHGSGTYIGDRLVLSCAHLWDRGTAYVGKSRVRIQFQQLGESYTGTLIEIRRSYDMSLIELDQLPQRIIGVPLARRNPQRGESIWFVGHPQAGPMYEQGPAPVTKYVGNGQHMDWVEANLPVISGYSGGGAFNSAGELIGNLWGSGQSHTVAVCTGRTHRFLLPWNARLDAWRSACGNGCVPPGWSGGRAPAAPQQPSGGTYGRPVPTPGPGDQPGGGLAPVAPQQPQQIDYDAILDRMAKDERFRGPQGPAGRDGTDGADGLPGRPAEIDQQQLARMIAASIQAAGPITVLADRGDGSTRVIGEANLGGQIVLPATTYQTIDQQGQVRDSATIGLGGVLKLNHHPLP